MAFNRVTEADKENKGVTGLPDTPNMTTADLQGRFDSLGNLAIDKLNQLMDEMEDTTAAGNIGITCPKSVSAGNTIQAVINALASKVDKNTGEAHSHANKDTLDEISSDSKTNWDNTATKFKDVVSVQQVITDAVTSVPSSHAVYMAVHDASFDDVNEAVQNAKKELEAGQALAKSWAVGGTGEREGEDYNNALFWANYAHTAEEHVVEAEKHVDTAMEKADLAQSWAVGGTGKREGEDTNNSKYWCEQAQGAVAGVASFNGRSGVVTPQSGDYSYDQISNTPSAATSEADGLMSSADKTKLDGIAEGATKVSIDSDVTEGSANAVSGGGVFTAIKAVKDSIVSTVTASIESIKTAIGDATTSTRGLMTAADKTKLDGIAEGANKTTLIDNLTTTTAGQGALDAHAGYSLSNILNNTGISQYRVIGSSYTFSNLVNDSNGHTQPIFFTNWSDATNFPANYGAGVKFAGLDSRSTFILYMVGGALYFYTGDWHKVSAS